MPTTTYEAARAEHAANLASAEASLQRAVSAAAFEKTVAFQVREGVVAQP